MAPETWKTLTAFFLEYSAEGKPVHLKAAKWVSLGHFFGGVKFWSPMIAAPLLVAGEHWPLYAAVLLVVG